MKTLISPPVLAGTLQGYPLRIRVNQSKQSHAWMYKSICRHLGGLGIRVTWPVSASKHLMDPSFSGGNWHQFWLQIITLNNFSNTASHMQLGIDRSEETRYCEWESAEITDNRNRATKTSDVWGYWTQTIKQLCLLCSRKEKAKLENLDTKLEIENVTLYILKGTL